MKKTLGTVASVLLGLSFAAEVSAAPPAKAVVKAPVKAAPVAGVRPVVVGEWVTVQTLAFDHKLPKNWILIDKNRDNFSIPTLGQWRYSSPNAHAKIFIRVSQLRPGGITVALARGIGHMKRKVEQLKKLETIDLPAGPNGGKALLAYFTGVTAAFSVGAKKVIGLHHLIGRFVKQYKGAEQQVAITYYFAPRYEARAREFIQKHIDSFSLNDPVAVARFVAEEAADDETIKVVNPLPATKAALKAVIQQQVKASEAKKK